MLKTILKDAMARSLAFYNVHPQCWQGEDWWQLLPQEAEVFDIEPQRWAELAPVWEAFEFFAGRTAGWNDGEILREHPDLSAIMQAERELHPEWVGLAPTAQTFMRFAQHYAGVRLREAKAIFGKMEFWAVRMGVQSFADEWN